MTSGNFETIPVSSIVVDRPNRQRKELEKIDELAESIREHGLINPIVVTQDYEIVAGERRLAAHQLLGYDMIPVQFAENLTPIQLHLIELEENVRRVDLSWQDHVNAVATYHALQMETVSEWSQDKTAASLNMSQANVGRHLLVKKAIDSGVKEVLESPKFTTAANFAQRQADRKKSSALRDLTSSPVEEVLKAPDGSIIPADPAAESVPSGPARFAEIQLYDFKDFASIVQPDPFNFIHCDFPYGVNAGDTKGQSAAKSMGGYDDGADIYWSLVDVFLKHQDRFIAPSAHLMFWFSMDYYQETKLKFEASGWRVNPFPLIWHKTDNVGILNDANRGPRRIYETAFLASRGDRKIVRAVGNAFGCATTKKYHMSEKAEPMLSHFLRMLVDSSTRMLDPTCGSGNAVKVSEELGAGYSLGLEMNEEYVERAKENLELL